MKTGIELIAKERQEQIEKHGWSLEHDKYYADEQLVQAAEFCLEQADNPSNESKKWPNGWDDYFENKIRAKTKVGKYKVAGAFYMAENDRLGNDKYLPEIESIAIKIDKI